MDFVDSTLLNAAADDDDDDDDDARPLCPNTHRRPSHAAADVEHAAVVHRAVARVTAARMND